MVDLARGLLVVAAFVALGDAPAAAQSCGRWQRVGPVEPTSTDWFTAAAYGGGRYLVADMQELFSSADGRTWGRVRCTMGPDECLVARRIEAVLWDGFQFLAIGNSGRDRVYRITDDGLGLAGDCPGGF
ncbi:MAG TPA: hypothetical protein VLT32_18365 [Candidatus Sulfomarinibacteraceae bacterium]|nr:hypothetical protein [Candidatus Sulfomarinibacteraceae bacterium]